jgi:hypothetical protein
MWSLAIANHYGKPGTNRKDAGKNTIPAASQ